MKASISSCQGVARVLRTIAAASLWTGVFSSYATSAPLEPTTPPATPTPKGLKAAPTQPPASVQPSPEESKLQEDWRASMMQTPPPKKGCFKSSYPSKEWKEIKCTKAPLYPMPPRRGPLPLTVGNFMDVSAEAPTGFISTAIGSFDSVAGVTSVSSPIGNSGPPVADAYALELNTDFFSSPTACVGSPNPACRGWQQFVFFNDPDLPTSYLLIQYWLRQYNAPCPVGGWTPFSFTGSTDIHCIRNSNMQTPVPNQPITNLGQLSLSGIVAGGDSVAFSTGSTAFTATGDNSVNAAAGWRIAEFNVFGAGGNSDGGSQATFNSGATVTARTRVIYPGTAAPNCVVQGFTGETNNLSFGTTPPAASPPGPALIFTESTAGVLPPNCAAATTVGDTHLATFNGLFYDFQASGDFVLGEVAPDFIVQTRQVSGAPTWPDASINNAVATRMGKTQVAICLAPAGNGTPARLNIDGKPTDLGDGQALSLPDGVDVSRRGNVYVITGQRGDSVRAEINAGWINVSVGLGRWPVKVRGLIANANGNVNQIETRDGTVLTNPFSFEDLYHRYADSWRVASSESLLSVCGGREIERGIPKRPFYADDLDPKVRERTRAACTAAGVKAGPLLEACTLDVAVIGHDDAAKVFVGAPAPIAVGIVTPSGDGGRRLIVWLLLLLIVIAFILWLLIRKTPPTP